jgi:hypothetical protein
MITNTYLAYVLLTKLFQLEISSIFCLSLKVSGNTRIGGMLWTVASTSNSPEKLEK